MKNLIISIFFIFALTYISIQSKYKRIKIISIVGITIYAINIILIFLKGD